MIIIGFFGLLFAVFVLNLAQSIANNEITEENIPISINTWAFTNAAESAWKSLSSQGSALDAIEAACIRCEVDQCDGTVGYGGSPDENGETTLDAFIMDGVSMNIGAVGNLRRVKNAISVARNILEHTGHSFLSGDQATDFAKQMGFAEETLTTNRSQTLFSDWKKNNCQPNFWINVSPDPTTSCGPYKKTPVGRHNKEIRKKHKFGRFNHDTIGIVVIDGNSQIAAGTSTNGASHKIPGRIGDSPLPGAGAYADNDVGGAAATGDGDIMARFLPSFLAVEEMRRGATPQAAANAAIERIIQKYKHFSGGIVVLNKSGSYGAACYGLDSFPFSIAKNDQVSVETVQCLNNDL